MKIIVAASLNNVIGKEGSIPWHLRSDLLRFKELTRGKAVVMGRKTYESLPLKPLLNRMNIVVTRQHDFTAPGIRVVHSLEEAINISHLDTFVIGGESLYREALPITSEILITRVLTTCSGDTFFPEINQDEWSCISRLDIRKDERDDHLSLFEVWKRK